MLAGPDFDDVVLFDVPAEHADALSARLNASRLTWLERNHEDELFVVAALRVEAEDLAGLLREVVSWLAESDLPYVRFILDGRAYILQPEEAQPGG